MNEVSIFAVIVFPRPWPLDHSKILFQKDQGTMVIALIADPNGSLRVASKFDGNTKQYQFQKIAVHGAGRAIINLIKGSRSCTLNLNGTQLKRLKDSNNKVYQLIDNGASPQDANSFNRLDVSRAKKQTEWFFLETINDLNEKLKINTKYSLIRASGFLRELLCDRPSLVETVNANYRVQFQFEIPDPLVKPPIQPDMHLTNPDTSAFPGAKTIQVDLSTFLRFECLEINRKVASVNAVIKACAHVMGGIHFYPARTSGEQTVVAADEFLRVLENRPSLYILREICRVTLKGIQPLIDRILR